MRQNGGGISSSMPSCRTLRSTWPFFGVDTTLCTPGAPLPRKDPALMTSQEVVHALRHTAVEHNIRLMHRLSREQLFVGTLEAARGEKDPARIRAYVAIFEEYFTYWSVSQKEQTLEFLYELLLQPDGDIRRQSAHLMGHILAGFSPAIRRNFRRCRTQFPGGASL